MANKRFGLGIPVMVLVFGMVFIGCDNGAGNGVGNELFPPGSPDIRAASTATTITLSWDAADSDVIDFRFSRADSEEGPFVNQGTINAPSVITQLSITSGLLPDTTYYFRIIATNGAGSSQATELAVSTMAEDAEVDIDLDAPSNFRVTATAHSSITLAFGTVSGATGYELAFAVNDAGPWTNHSGGTGISRTISGLNLNTRYYFRVRTLRNNAVSEWSAVINGSTLTLNAPSSNISANSISASGMRITWDSVLGASNYQLQRASTTEGPWQNVTSSTNSLFADVTGLSGNSAYYFRLRAAIAWSIDDDNSSDWVTAGPFTTLSPPTASLATAVWMDGNSTNANRLFWYTFDVVEGQQYFIWANTGWSGDGTTTAGTPFVAIRYNDGTLILTANPQFNGAPSFTASQTGTVRLEVSFTSNGTFAIVYNTIQTRP